MATNGNKNLELALSQTEEDADAACKAATTALRAMKKFCAAAQAGNLRELRRAIETAGQTIAELERQFTKAKTGWGFEEETYSCGCGGRARTEWGFAETIIWRAWCTGMPQRVYCLDDRFC